MSQRRPPRLAAWLLRRTGVAANEPLAGDLFEEFHQGRSVGWYWRQTGTAILSVIARGFRAERPSILAWILGWLVETVAVVIALRLFPSANGLGFAWRAAALFAGAALVIYIDYRVRLHLWFNECEMTDEESEIFLKHRIWTRLLALGSFGAYILADLIACGIGPVDDGIRSLVHMGPTSWGLTDIILVHVIWIATNVAQMAMRAAGPNSQKG